MVFRHISYKKKLPHIMGNEAKPYKEKEKRATTLPTRAQQHIAYKLTSQNQHTIVVLAPSYDAVLWTLQAIKRHTSPLAVSKQTKTPMPTTTSTSAPQASPFVSITIQITAGFHRRAQMSLLPSSSHAQLSSSDFL
jgi:hypothetical protein